MIPGLTYTVTFSASFIVTPCSLLTELNDKKLALRIEEALSLALSDLLGDGTVAVDEMRLEPPPISQRDPD